MAKKVSKAKRVTQKDQEKTALEKAASDVEALMRANAQLAQGIEDAEKRYELSESKFSKSEAQLHDTQHQIRQQTSQIDSLLVTLARERLEAGRLQTVLSVLADKIQDLEHSNAILSAKRNQS